MSRIMEIRAKVLMQLGDELSKPIGERSLAVIEACEMALRHLVVPEGHTTYADHTHKND
jgi:hypothetical protein